MKGRGLGVYAMGLSAGLVICGVAAWGFGLRINMSSSVPVGLWRQTSIDRPLRQGDIVAVCPDTSAPFRLAKERGYFSSGWCGKSRDELLFKPVAAVVGDQVKVDNEGIQVNGVRVGNTAPLPADSRGRALPAVARGTYPVEPGFIWLVSPNAQSFDSRYFGAVRVSQMRGKLTPLWTWSSDRELEKADSAQGRGDNRMFDPALIALCAPTVARTTMEEVIRAESGGDPLALNINGYGRVVLKSKPEAIAQAEIAIAYGYTVDVGLMQVNSQNFVRFHITLRQAFETCTNLRVGAAVLNENYTHAAAKWGPGQIALQHALSAYNTGDFNRGFGNGYVARYYRRRGPVFAQAKEPKGSTPGAGE